MSPASERELFWRCDPELAPALEALGWPDPAAVAAAFERRAATGRSATALLALPGRSERVHVRRVQHGGWLGPLWRGSIWGPGRPAAEWDVNAGLCQSGAPVPRPALALARRGRGPCWTAVYGTVHIEGARDGLAWLASRPAPTDLLAGARAAGAAIRRFHDAGGTHPDLHLKNLLLREESGTMRVWVIDLDGARIAQPPSPARRMRELMRLLRSLRKRGVADIAGPRGVAAAFAAYCAGDRQLRRQLWRRLPAESLRNALHGLTYRRVAPDASAGGD